MNFAKLTTVLAAITTVGIASSAHAQTATGTPSSPPTTTSASDGTLTATVTPAGIQTGGASSGDSMTIYRNIHPNRPLLLTGTGLLLAGYIPTLVMQAAEGRSEDNELYIPVAGPWINLAERNCPECENEDTTKGLLIASGIAQSAGAVIAITSLFVPEKIEAARIQAGPVNMLLTPTAVGRGGAGMGAVGTF